MLCHIIRVGSFAIDVLTAQIAEEVGRADEDCKKVQPSHLKRAIYASVYVHFMTYSSNIDARGRAAEITSAPSSVSQKELEKAERTLEEPLFRDFSKVVASIKAILVKRGDLRPQLRL